ncbi:MAG: STAS-like domain-containing protein, partial [Pseudomonadota bacterium]
EVILDFEGVPQIGQAFADEIFRVFRQDHPGIDIFAIRTNPEVAETIERVQKPIIPTN